MIKFKNIIASKTISFTKLNKLIKSQKFQFKIKPAGSNPRIAAFTAGRYLSGFKLP